jgi:hypothetical protein
VPDLAGGVTDGQEAGDSMKIAITTDGQAVRLHDDGTWKDAAPSGPVRERWEGLPQPPHLVEMLQGLFRQVGVRIIDGGEEFTCVQQPESIALVDGIDRDAVDFTLAIYGFQAERFAEQLAAGEVDDLEQFRIARVLVLASLTSAGRYSIWHNPLMSNPFLRWWIRGKNLLHLYLISPDPGQEEDLKLTLMHINRRWLGIPGLYGEPRRVFRVTVADALELQRHLFAAMNAGSWAEWLETARWYLRWRERVEVPLRQE